MGHRYASSYSLGSAAPLFSVRVLVGRAESGYALAMRVRVRVPATSANLGPGFDALGLALALYNEVTIAESDRTRSSSRSKARERAGSTPAATMSSPAARGWPSRSRAVRSAGPPFTV